MDWRHGRVGEPGRSRGVAVPSSEVGLVCVDAHHHPAGVIRDGPRLAYRRNRASQFGRHSFGAVTRRGRDMAGISLHIGLNRVDPKHYAGWAGPLNACEADAIDMEAIAAGRGLSTNVLLTKDATREATRTAIRAAANKLVAGDLFVISYSGHGGQLPDLNDEESDGQDETWCLYDGQWVDDEMYAALSEFAPKVRVLLLSDSCHSGTVAKATAITDAIRDASAIVYRAMPDEVTSRVYFANKSTYDPILADASLAKAAKGVRASVLLISGCQDNQLSADGPFNGRFTGALKRVWNSGKFKGDYRKFHGAIVARMPPDQTPNYYLVGAPDPAFESETPFHV